MTIERPVRDARMPAGRTPLSPLEWRLHLVSGLAITYSLAVLGIARSLPASDASPSIAAQPADRATPRTPRATWFDAMPAGERPSITLPAGYRLADGRASDSPGIGAPRDATRVRRHPVRIRTRSS